jgi:hypothetical protein
MASETYLYRVRWYLTSSKQWWWCDFNTEQEAQQRVKGLLHEGFWTRRKSGIMVFYRAHRIREIQIRPNKPQIAAMQAMVRRQQIVQPN